jgi:hypothetical protein
VISQQYIIYELEIQKGRKKEKKTKRKEGSKKKRRTVFHHKTIRSQKVAAAEKSKQHLNFKTLCIVYSITCYVYFNTSINAD